MARQLRPWGLDLGAQLLISYFQKSMIIQIHREAKVLSSRHEGGS